MPVFKLNLQPSSGGSDKTFFLQRAQYMYIKKTTNFDLNTQV